MYVSYAIARLFDLIMLLLLIYVLLTWIRTINWGNEPFRTLKLFADTIFAPFRKIIPPIGMIDISPVIAFIVLDIVKEVLVRLLRSIGL